MGQMLAPTDQALESRVGPETVILHLESGYYFGLDAVGTRVWELLKEGNTVESICTHLRQEYSDAGDAVENDVRAFIEDLLQNNLLEERASPEAQP